MRANASWRALRAQIKQRQTGATGWAVIVLPPSFYLMIVCYPLCNWYNRHHAEGILGQEQLALAADSWIPFSPWALPLYLSFFGFFLLHRELLSRGSSGRRHYRSIETSLILVTLVSCSFFLWFPSSVELRDQALDSLVGGAGPEWLRKACAGLYGLDGSFNAWPSLHVSLPLLILLATSHLALFERWQLVCLRSWLVAVLCSVLLLKQHYIWDVLSALLLVTLVWMFWLRPRLRAGRMLPMQQSMRGRTA